MKIKNWSMSKKISIVVIIMLIIGLSGLCLFVNNRTNKTMKTATINRLSETTETRAKLIDTYLDNTAQYLEDYGQADEVINFLKNPSDKKLLKVAQDYTDRYGATVDNIEGLFISSMDTYTYTHINHEMIGKYSKTDKEAIEALDKVLESTKDVYSPGVVLSPASGNQVIVNYYTIYDNGKAIGYVGAAVNATGLMDILNGLEMKGLDNSQYYLVNANTSVYIFAKETKNIGQEVKDTNLLKIISTVKDNEKIDTSTFEYTGSSGDMLAVYKNMSERGWIFIVQDKTSEVYAAVNSLSKIVFIICIVVLILVAAISWIAVSFIAKDLVYVGNVISDVGLSLDLTKSSDLDKFKGRKDEIGNISTATVSLVEAIKEAVVELKEKGQELFDTSGKLSDISGNALSTVSQVDTAVQEIAQGATDQATETEKASESVISIGEQIKDTSDATDVIRENSIRMQESGEKIIEVINNLSTISEKAKSAVDDIYEQTNTTNNSAMKIKEATAIINSIAEETNLLSLNASIEAARAGEQGKGFSVVATQIRKLAEQSADSVQQIEEIISVLLADSSTAVDTMDEVKEIMNQQSIYMEDTISSFTSVKNGIDQTITGVNGISHKVEQMDSSRNAVVDVVQSLSAIAEENAANAEETSASTSIVSELMNDISDSAKEVSAVAEEMDKTVSIFKI